MDYFKYVDYTCLKPTATIRDIEKICDEAMKYHVATVCVNPYYVPLVAGILKDSTIGVTAVVGFPLGANTTRVKTLEAIEAIEDGATEIDLVININALKNKDYDIVLIVAHSGVSKVFSGYFEGLKNCEIKEYVL